MANNAFQTQTKPSETELACLQHHAKEIAGALCVFGDWFGRPMDNWHQVISFESSGDYLKLTFDEGETLEVWGAQGLRVEGRYFVIQRANRVRWEWFYYGRPKQPENRFFREHVVKDGQVTATSDVTWYRPVFRPSLQQPAVSIQ